MARGAGIVSESGAQHQPGATHKDQNMASVSVHFASCGSGSCNAIRRLLTRVGVNKAWNTRQWWVNEEVSKYRVPRLLWEFAQNCTLVHSMAHSFLAIYV